MTSPNLFYFKLNAAYIINNAQASTIIIEDVIVSILNMGNKNSALSKTTNANALMDWLFSSVAFRKLRTSLGMIRDSRANVYK